MIPIKFQCISTPQYHVDFGIKEIHAKAWQEVAYNHIYSATLATLFYLRKFCTFGDFQWNPQGWNLNWYMMLHVYML